MVSSQITIPCGIALVTYVFVRLWAQRRQVPKPPGPSFMEIDPKALAVHPWKTFHEWALKYGPLVSWTMFGKTTVVIDSAKIVEDLFEARSAIYSDRPLCIMATVLAERKHVVPLTSSQDPRFKIYRRLMNGGMSSNAIRAYRSIQVEELHKFLKALESSPERFNHEIRRNACAVIMKVAYGYELKGSDDEFVKFVDEGFSMFVKLVEPGWMVEFFPWLRFIPEWFPGANFKRVAREAMHKLWLVDHKPFQWAMDQISSGSYIESFISHQLEEPTPYIPDGEKEDCLKWVAGSLYGGGVDTTGSALTTFFYVMQMYPEVQKRAQEELEALTGGQRLVTFEDYESLPYIRAVLKEILRWGTVAPLGLVHSVIQDDIYEGYLIPKGSTILANIWAILHDPELYPEPFMFNPERHLGQNPQTDPLKYVFGFGRRVCPGSYLAQASLFLNAVNVLAIFDISKEVDANGKEIEPPQVWTTSLASSLEAFPCKIKVRSPELLATIQ